MWIDEVGVRRGSLACAMFVLLGGCAGSRATELNRVERAASPTQALVLGSVSAPKHGHYWEIVTFALESTDGETRQRLRSASPATSFLWWGETATQPGAATPSAGLEGELGRLFAVAVPPGEYRLTYQPVKSRGRPVTSWPVVDLFLAAGSTTYIGNLYLEHCVYSPPKGGRGFIYSGLPSIRDMAQRDVPLLRSQVAGLMEAVVETRVPSDEIWADRSCPPCAGSARNPCGSAREQAGSPEHGAVASTREPARLAAGQ